MADTGRRWLLPAELALAAVGFVVVLGMTRLLEDAGFLVPVLGTWGAVVAIAMVARRRGWGLVVSAAASATAVVILLAWLVLPEHTALGIPTPGTIGSGIDALVGAWSSFDDVSAPAPADPGFVLSAALAASVAAFLADWAAFRIWSAVEALVPWLTLFVFTALLGTLDGRLVAAAAFAGTSLAFVLLHRVAREARRSSWLTADVSGAARSMVRLGAGLGAVALLVGLAAGPLVPGADEPAVVSLRPGDSGGGQRVTISPLVEIRSRLVEQSDLELFTVEADAPAYWRLTSLDTYGEDIWRSSGRYSAVNGSLPESSSRSAGPVTELDQVVTIEALSALWLPAAFEPRTIEAPTDVRYHPESATLIVDTDVPTSDGMTYRVSSLVPGFTPDELRTAEPEASPEIADQYLPLPPDASPLAESMARDVTAGLGNDYDRARALQDWFQREFTYDLSIPAGHGDDAVAAFLSRRSGYCEQFAGTFALMARQLGIPARVAVGFTPGDVDPDDPNRFVVRGEFAHAWPEVHLGRYGWVAFEPTPGRGAPGAEQHTGLPAAQSATSDPAVTPTTATTTPADAEPGTATTAPTTPDLDPVPAERSAEAATGRSTPTTVALLMLGLAVAWVVAVPALLELRRRRRRRAASSPAEQVTTAWSEVTEAMAEVGAAPAPGQTSTEWVGSAAAIVPRHAERLDRLAHDVDEVAFGPGAIDAARARGDVETADAVAAEVHSTLSRWRRIARRFDPRPLLRR